MTPTRRVLPLVSALVFALGLVTACGTGPRGQAEHSPPGYPKSIRNCGRTVTVPAPPRRAVSLDQGSTEILLSLGLADRMVGTAMWTDPVLPHLRAANARVPRLADRRPSFERVLAQEPDFVSASFTSTMNRVASGEEFAELGVPSYIAPSDCAKADGGSGDGSRDRKLRMRSIHREISDLATLFGVPRRGERLVTDLRNRFEAAAGSVDASGVDVLYWFANSRAPYMAGCCGAPGIITDAVGAHNVFDDTRKEWPQVGWETVAARDPDVLVLGDLTRRTQSAESARAKIRFLESHPVTRHMDAVRHHRYVRLSGAAMNPSIRTVRGVEKVARALREFGLAG